MEIFHIATESDWASAQQSGAYTTSTRGRTLEDEGFLHAGRRDQVAGVFNRYYADADEPLVITCRSGGRVQRVMPWLAQQGYEVANMDGGMRAWLAAGKPMEAAGGAEPHVP